MIRKTDDVANFSYKLSIFTILCREGAQVNRI